MFRHLYHRWFGGISCLGVNLLNYAVSLDEARDGTQTNTQGVWPCILPIDSLPLQQLALSPTLMSYLSK